MNDIKIITDQARMLAYMCEKKGFKFMIEIATPVKKGQGIITLDGTSDKNTALHFLALKICQIAKEGEEPEVMTEIADVIKKLRYSDSENRMIENHNEPIDKILDIIQNDETEDEEIEDDDND